MGIGSPRLLGKLVRRTAVTFIVALGFAPSAFADNSIASLSTNVGSTSATASVTVAPTPSVDVKADVAAPSPSQPPAPAPAAPSAPAVNAALGTTPTTIGVTVPTSLRVAAPTSASIPRGWQSALAHSAAVRESHTRLLSSSAVRGASTPRTAVATPMSTTTRTWPTGGQPQTPRLPQLPVPAPVGFTAAGSTASSAAFALLLLALAMALAVLALPRLGRRLALLASAPRPYAYLLELERPD